MRCLQRVVLVLLAVILVCTPSSLVYAALPDDATLDMYNANGIYYYNPNGGTDCGPGSVGLVDGEGNEAYVWNWFAQAGIAGVSDNAAVIAGIVGNMRIESLNYETHHGANPFEWGMAGNGYPYPFYGLVMWDSGFEPAIPEMIRENGWWEYLHKASEAPNVPPDILKQALDLQLEYLVNHSNFGLFTRNLGKVSNDEPESYAELFLVTVERAINGSDLLQDNGVLNFARNNMDSSGWYQGASERRESARMLYDQFANSTTSFISTAGVDADGWVGGIEGLQKEDARNEPDLGDFIETKFLNADGKETDKASMIVLHYTAGEGNGLNAYRGNPEGIFPAHFTIDLVKEQGYQHFPLSQPSMAVSTYDRYAIQIEIVGNGYKDWGITYREDDEYNLYNFTDEQWDYLAYYLNAISGYTGIPLTSQVTWDVDWSSYGGNKKTMTDADAKAYKGILGHMHLPDNDGKTDPGDIWEQVEAALKRNPSSTYNAACIPSGAVSGGLTLEQAEKFMQAYIDLMWATGDVQPKDNFVTEWTLYNTCSPSLANCSTFSQYFMNRYTASFRDNHFTHVSDGGKMVYRVLVEHAGEHSYTDGGHIPKAYALFSKAGVPGYACDKASGYLGCGHTGIVLGVDEANNKIIIGESGCDDPGFTGAKEKELSDFLGENYTYAYTDALIDEISKTVLTGV